MTEVVVLPEMEDEAIRGGSDCADPNGDLKLELKRTVTDSKNMHAGILKKSKALSLRCKKVCHKQK